MCMYVYVYKEHLCLHHSACLSFFLRLPLPSSFFPSLPVSLLWGRFQVSLGSAGQQSFLTELTCRFSLLPVFYQVLTSHQSQQGKKNWLLMCFTDTYTGQCMCKEMHEVVSNTRNLLLIHLELQFIPLGFDIPAAHTRRKSLHRPSDHS